MGDAGGGRGPALSLVVLRVADLEASRRFYEALGLAFRAERHGRGPAHLSTAVGGVVLELYPRASSAATDGLRLGLTVADLDGVAARCAPAVVSDGSRDGDRVVVVRDPDGHRIELTQT